MDNFTFNTDNVWTHVGILGDNQFGGQSQPHILGSEGLVGSCGNSSVNWWGLGEFRGSGMRAWIIMRY